MEGKEGKSKIGQRLSSDTASVGVPAGSLRSPDSWAALQNHPKLGQKDWAFLTVLGWDHLRRGALGKAGVFNEGRSLAAFSQLGVLHS